MNDATRDDLLPYYEQELAFIREMAGEFKAKYPAVAGGLLLDDHTCDDPHVERLIESFALLAGRVQRKIDDEYPEITEAILDVLCPHYLRPVPSQAIAQFRLDPGHSAASAVVEVPSGSRVHSKPQEGNVCSFRTCYPVKLWPLRVTGASFSTPDRFVNPGTARDVAAVIRIQLECLGGLTLAQLPIESIRLYLDGDASAVHNLYQTIFLNTSRVALRAIGSQNTAHALLPPDCLRQVGFAADESVLPYREISFSGYRLLQEYLSFPKKFLFVDIVGFDRVALAAFGDSFEILISLREGDYKRHSAALEQAVNAGTFKLGCTPIVNLFERIAEPIRITQTKTEYRVVPDQHRQTTTEVYSIERVASLSSYDEEPKVYPQIYNLRHRVENSELRCWYAHRRSSFRKGDDGTEVYLSLVDLDFTPALPPVDLLTVHVLCTNREEAASINVSGEFGELEPEGLDLTEVRCLGKPSSTLRPPLRRGLQWRLISHLSLNYLSLVEGGRDALQEILRLYDFSDDAVVRKQIAGIRKVSSRPEVSRISSETGVAFCRGTHVEIEFDESEYVGTGIYLFASVLERFLGLYAAVNSWSRLTAKTGKGVLKQWPPRAGDQVLL